MFASHSSACGSGSRRASASKAFTVTPLATPFSTVDSTPIGSMSQARSGLKPSLPAATESTPEPQPRSSTGPVGSMPHSSSRVSSVDGCEPVPNARPGSMTTGRRPGGGSSQGGPTHSRSATERPRWNAFQASSQPSGTSTTDVGSNPDGSVAPPSA